MYRRYVKIVTSSVSEKAACAHTGAREEFLVVKSVPALQTSRPICGSKVITAKSLGKPVLGGLLNVFTITKEANTRSPNEGCLYNMVPTAGTKGPDTFAISTAIVHSLSAMP